MPGYGFALAGEKSLDFGVTVGAGFARIDPNYGAGLNGDFYPPGKRLFASASWRLSSELSLRATYGRGLGDDLDVAGRNRLDLVLSYDMLAAVKKAFGR
jgi:hypothetical protein